jgi:hypothetical protein
MMNGRYKEHWIEMKKRSKNILNRVAVAEGSRGFQPPDKRKKRTIRRVATIEPADHLVNEASRNKVMRTLDRATKW